MSSRSRGNTEGSGHGGLFEPDVLLPNQFFASFRRGRVIEGEKRLMLAVLEDAVDTFRKTALAQDARGRASYHEAREWIFSNDQKWLFSFENICQTLEMNSCYIRQGLDNWQARQMKARQRAEEVPPQADQAPPRDGRPGDVKHAV